MVRPRKSLEERHVKSSSLGQSEKVYCGNIFLYDITFAANESGKTEAALQVDPFISPRAKAEPGLLHFLSLFLIPAGAACFPAGLLRQVLKPTEGQIHTT